MLKEQIRRRAVSISANTKMYSMTNEQIQSFFLQAKLKERKVRIDFKSRASITGLFIESFDSAELNAKNFWRIVNESRIEEFQSQQDSSLARIFNGNEFTRLSVLKAKA